MRRTKFLQKWIAWLFAFLMVCSLGSSGFAMADEGQESGEDILSTQMDFDSFKAQFLSDSVTRNLNLPSTIVGLWATPGEDFLKSDADSDSRFYADVEALLEKAKKYQINTLYIETNTQDGTLLSDMELAKAACCDGLTIDPVQYLIEEAKSAGLYVICTLDLLRFTLNDVTANFDWLNASAMDFAIKRAQKFAKSYAPDGVLLTNFYNPETAFSANAYYESGSGIGLENELAEQTLGLLDSVAYAIKRENFTMAIGLLCDSVWANEGTDANGSQTKADFEMKTDGNLNLPELLASRTVDYILVDVPYALQDSKVPMGEVVNFWAVMASKNDFVLTYRLHNELVCGKKEGFSSPDQLVRQVICAENSGYYSGCCLASLSALDANTSNNATVLIRHLTEGLSKDLILKDLYMTRPTRTSFVTYDNTVQFTGTSDPNFPVTVNEKEITVSKEGNFSVTYDLKTGVNTFTLKHKSTEVTYTITKKLKILDSISPSGSVSGNGKMVLTFSASAYTGAKVTLTVKGKSYTMKEMETEGDAENAGDGINLESAYRTFTCAYTLPEATYSVQKLGNFQITAEYEGFKETMNGGTISVNAKPKPQPEVPSETPSVEKPSVPISKPEESSASSAPSESSAAPSESSQEISQAGNITPATDTGKIAAPGDLVQLTDTYENGWIETFETTVLNDYATPLVYYYVPGTYDYVNGKMLEITFDGQQIQYYNLCSGRRIYVADTKKVTDTTLKEKICNNTLSSFDITVSGKNTLITFGTTYPVNPVISLEGVKYAANEAMNHTVSDFAPTYLLVELPYIGDVPKIAIPGGSLFEKATSQRITDADTGIRKLELKLYFKNGKAFSGASSYLNEKGQLVICVRNKMNIEKSDNAFGYRLDGVKIGITPGHGGGDTGASGFNGVNEVDLNFKIADLVGQYLESIGAEVVQLPRNITDRTEGLHTKMENARNISPDILLCLHHNSASSSTVTGTETFYYSPFTQPLAAAVNNRLAAVFPVMYGYSSKSFNRGAKYSPKYMCRDMRFPAILVEYGFINNPDEFALLSKEENQKLLAQATVQGIIDYILAQQ